MKKTVFFLLTLSLLLNSCFKDDLSDCPAKLQVYFESVMTKYRYEDVTEKLDLYLYNGANLLAGTYSYSKEELEALDYRPVLPLGICDRYTLLALANAENCYVVNGAEHLYTFSVSLQTQNGDTVRQQPADLFFAGEEITNVGGSKKERYLNETLPLFKNTNHIYVNVTFESPFDVQKSDLHAYIQGNNGSSDYQNRCHPASYRIYLPHETNWNQGRVDIQYQFTTMQLWIESDLELLLEDGKEEKVRLTIMDYISKIYETDEELNQEDYFYLDLIIKNDFTILELKVNGWYVIRSGVEV